jgi:hypothetical protein
VSKALKARRDMILSNDLVVADYSALMHEVPCSFASVIRFTVFRELLQNANDAGELPGNCDPSFPPYN